MKPIPPIVLVTLVMTACSSGPLASESAGASAAATPTAPPSPTAAASQLSSAVPSLVPTATLDPGPPSYEVATYPVPPGSRPHDVAPAVDGGVWYTAQRRGALGWLDPGTGEVHEIPLGGGAAPHGVIVGPDGAAWVTDGGLNAIVRVEAETDAVEVYPLPASAPNANLNTAAFDGDGILWFTGQAGWYGRLDPATGEMAVFAAPRGTGPYGITATPDGEIYYASLAGSYLGAVERASGEVRVLEPPTGGAGVRRAWSDSQGRIWIAEWNAGQLGRYDPAADAWVEWPLPGQAPRAYAVYVDERDAVWVTDFGGNATHRFDPTAETFITFPADSEPAEVRQLLGRPGEVWGAESAADRLVVIRESR